MTALWSETSDEGIQFDEQVKMSKLRTIVPSSIFNFIAMQAAECPDYDSLVALIETQIMDPDTGLPRVDTPPGLNELTKEKAVLEVLAHMGYETDPEWVAQIIAAAGKGKGEEKAKAKPVGTAEKQGISPENALTTTNQPYRQ